ncbi:MAG: MarC family protein [Candidatus Hadarchaeales archaeon]
MDEIVKSSLSLFVIMSPFTSLPIFISLTKDMGEGQKALAASHAVGTAAIVLFAFLFFGRAILSAFGINFHSLKIAGGILLMILGIEIVLGLSPAKYGLKYSPAISLIGTPLLTGPGVIVTTMILVQEYGYLVTSVASIASLVASWFILWCSRYISRLLGKYGLEIVSRVMGLLLVAVAVEFMLTGIKASL